MRLDEGGATASEDAGELAAIRFENGDGPTSGHARTAIDADSLSRCSIESQPRNLARSGNRYRNGRSVHGDRAGDVHDLVDVHRRLPCACA